MEIKLMKSYTVNWLLDILIAKLKLFMIFCSVLLMYSDSGKCSVMTRIGQIGICLPRNSRAVLMLRTLRLIASILNYLAWFLHFL